MSNVVTFNPTAGLPALPADLVRAGEEMSAELGGGLQGRVFNRIAIRQGRFVMLTGGEVVQRLEKDHIDVVIVGSSPNVSRVFYIKGYDANAPKERPTCWSHNGVTPASDVAEENRQGSACNTCPKNEKGSAKDGKSRACAFKKAIAIVPGGGEEVRGINAAEPAPWQMVVNAQSMYDDSQPDQNLYSLKGFVEFLGRPRQGAPKGIPAGYLLTRIQIDVEATTSKCWFSPLGYLTPDQIAKSVKLFRSDEVRDLLDQTADETALAQHDRSPGVPETDRTMATPPAATPAAAAPKAAAPKAAAPTPPPPPPAPAAEQAADGDEDLQPIHWIDYATDNAVDTDTIDAIYALGGPGSAGGRKIWDQLVGLELDELVVLALEGATTYNPAPPPTAPAPAAPKVKRGRPSMTAEEKAAAAAARAAKKAAAEPAQSENPAPIEAQQSLPIQPAPTPAAPPPAQPTGVPPGGAGEPTRAQTLASRISKFDD